MSGADSTRRRLDMEVISSLRDLGGDDLLRELVDLFRTDARERLDELERALQAGLAEDVQIAAHTVKSSSGNLGAVWLSETCARIEELARSRDLSGVPPVLEECRRAFDSALSDLLALL